MSRVEEQFVHSVADRVQVADRFSCDSALRESRVDACACGAVFESVVPARVSVGLLYPHTTYRILSDTAVKPYGIPVLRDTRAGRTRSLRTVPF